MNSALFFRLVLYPQVMLLIFLFIGTLLIAGFLGYHCSLIARGMTSYETFKWQDYKDHCMEIAGDSRCLLLLFLTMHAHLKRVAINASMLTSTASAAQH